jgi:hypothetical protein
MVLVMALRCFYGLLNFCPSVIRIAPTLIADADNYEFSDGSLDGPSDSTHALSIQGSVYRRFQRRKSKSRKASSSRDTACDT